MTYRERFLRCRSKKANRGKLLMVMRNLEYVC